MIFKASKDKDEAERLMDWFLEQGWLQEKKSVQEFMEDGPYCTGCHGDKETHWSPDCRILKCCVDERELDNCSGCSDFPCEKLKEWAAGDEEYTEAFERLRALGDE